MAKKKEEGEWAFHVAAFDGAETYGFGDNKKNAEDMRKELIAAGTFLFVSNILWMVIGKTYWVVHLRNKRGRMHSFGFESQVEAQKFHNALQEVEGVELRSRPSEAELKG